MFDLVASLQTIFAITALLGIYFALPGIAVYYILRAASRPLAKAISNLPLVEEKRSISRLLPSAMLPAAIKRIKTEQDLTQLLKDVAVRNGWDAEDVQKLPVWWLTGHLANDANPSRILDPYYGPQHEG